jgi:hypothetical protein
MPRVVVIHGASSCSYVLEDGAIRLKDRYGGYEQVGTYDVTDGGCTPVSFMEGLYPATKNFPMPVRCQYAGNYLFRSEWPDTVLKGNELLIFEGLPRKGGGGGGSNPLQMVLMAVVVIIAAIATWYVGGAGGWAAFGGSGLGWGATAGYLAGAAVMIGGTLLIGALFQPAAISAGQLNALDAESSSPTYSLNASSNQARLGQPEPEQFGRIKVLPDVAAFPWSEYIGNELYLYQVFGVGRGIYRQESMFFGDVEIWRDGHILADSAYVEDNDVIQTYVNAELVSQNNGGTWSAPVNAAQSNTTKRMSVVISMPDGCCSYEASAAGYVQAGDYYDEYGNYVAPYQVWQRSTWIPVAKTVSVTLQYRPASGGAWKHLGDMSATFGNESPVADGTDANGKTIYRDIREDPKEFSKEFYIPEGYDNYEIRALNTSAYTGTLIAQEEQEPSGGWGGWWGSGSSSAPPITIYKDARERMVFSRIDASVSSIQIQIVPPGQSVSLFQDNVESSVSVAGLTLIAPNDEGHDWQGPFPVCSPGTKTSKIYNDFLFPRGLTRVNDSAGLGQYRVTWQVQYQRIDDFNNPTGDWAVLYDGDLSLATQTPQRMTQISNVAEGRYWCRAIRTSDTTGDTRTLDELQWGGLRAELPGSLRYGQSVIAVKMKATNKLSQASSERFSVIQTRCLPIYNRVTKTWQGHYDYETDTWHDCQPTRSFAAAVSWICKAPWGARLKDSQIDLDGLWALDEIITAKNWHTDCWLDGPYQNWGLLVEICAAVKVAPRLAGTVISFVMDVPDRPVRHEFTPYNIVRGSFKLTFLTFSESTPDDVNVSYLDESAGFAKRDVAAVLPDSESKETSEQTPISIVNRDHAFAYGWHLACCNRYRRVTAEFQTEGIGRMLNMGDICAVKHPRFRSLAYGKMTDWREDELLLYLDPEPKLKPPGENTGADAEAEGNVDTNPDTDSDASPDLYISFTRPDGTPWGPVKLESISGALARIDAEDYALLQAQGLESPFGWFTRGYDRLPTIWSLHTSRSFERRMIVKKIVPQDMYHHSLTLVSDDPRAYTPPPATPPWLYRSIAPIPDTLAAPQAMSATVNGTLDAPSVTVSWLPVPGATAYEVLYSGDGGTTWERKGRANINIMTFAVPQGAFSVAVYAVNNEKEGPRSTVSGDTSIIAPDAPVPALTTPYAGGQASIAWPEVTGAVSYTVRAFVEGRATPVRITEVTAPEFVYTAVMNMTDGGPYREMLFDVAATNGVKSSEPGAITVTDPAPAEIPLASIDGSVAATSVTINSVSTGGTGGTEGEADITGYVIARGLYANFLPSEVSEIRTVTAFPYTWDGLTPETPYFFRIAAKDAFFDTTSDFQSLNYSESVNIVTLAEDADTDEAGEETGGDSDE